MKRFRPAIRLTGLLLLIGSSFTLTGLASADSALAQSYNQPGAHNRPPLRPRNAIRPNVHVRPGGRQTATDNPSTARTVPVPPSGFPRPRPVLLPDALAGHPHSKFLFGSYQPDTLCVLMVAGTGLAGARDLAAIYDLAVEAVVPASLLDQELYRMRIPAGAQAHLVAATISLDPAVIAAGPNYLYNTGQSASPGGQQFALDRMNIAAAHRLATGSNVTVAVIDTGIDASHPELQGNVVESFDAVGGGAAVMGHGTAMAGVIASGARLTGVAPSVRLLSAQAFGQTRDGGPKATTFSIISGMDWAYRRGARLFNLSFAGPHDKMLERALDALADTGTIMVAAAGNAGPGAPPAWPAAHPGVIAVTATDERDGLYVFANRGSYVLVAAPGVDILTAAPDGRYELVSGTSVAAAHVTGVIALMLERFPDLNAAAVAQLLLRSSVDLGPAGMDAQFGAGRIDALSAVRAGELAGRASGQPTASDQ